jgi:nucleotide-binding universal stress UspA family protein
MTPRRIIVPVTFADDSYEAVAVAAAFAVVFGAELILAGIAPLAPIEPLLNTPDIGRLARQAEQQELLDRIVAERLTDLAAALSGIPSRTVQSSGSTGVALMAAARQARADLVVVPIRREGEIAHLVHDHVDRYVLHHSEVPVLVVPTNGGSKAHANGDTR